MRAANRITPGKAYYTPYSGKAIKIRVTETADTHTMAVFYEAEPLDEAEAPLFKSPVAGSLIYDDRKACEEDAARLEEKRRSQETEFCKKLLSDVRVMCAVSDDFTAELERILEEKREQKSLRVRV